MSNLEFTKEGDDLLEKLLDTDKRWFTSSCGRIEFQMTLEQAQSVCHTGQCISDVKALSNMPEIKAITDELDPETVRLVVREAYGDITEEELKDDEANIERLLWIAGCDIDEHENDSMITCTGCNNTVEEHGYCDKDGSGYGECCWGEHADKCESCKEDVNNG